jgi:hypothetical protein
MKGPSKTVRAKVDRTKTGPKAARSAKTRSRTKVGARAVAPLRGSALSLPPNAVPVRRGRSISPFRLRVAAAQQDCSACLSACAALPPPLRATCQIVCRSICEGRS